MSFKDYSYLDSGGHLVRHSRLGNFGKGYYVERFCEIILNLNQLFLSSAFNFWAFGFILLYSVVCTVESSSLLFMDNKLGVFHANQTSMCLDPHPN